MAMSILLLARRGQLSLDDEVRKHIPARSFWSSWRRRATPALRSGEAVGPTFQRLLGTVTTEKPYSARLTNT
jgi:CubicO group peptidase (beta-lactamase class C family)